MVMFDFHDEPILLRVMLAATLVQTLPLGTSLGRKLAPVVGYDVDSSLVIAERSVNVDSASRVAGMARSGQKDGCPVRYCNRLVI
jgi:hypothetical protein